MSKTLEQRDYTRRPLPYLIAWGLPILVLLSVIIFQDVLPAVAKVLVVAGAFIWMGTGCIVNALRCGRLHCYFSGPIQLLGGTLILLAGFGIVDLGPVKVIHIIYATIALVMLTYLSEWIWGRYAGPFAKTGAPDE